MAYAITMWDFSWAERRWPGAGYEDWDLALSDLKARGYDAVRIDAYPHLVAEDPEATWHLPPCWTQMAWGAQSPMDLAPGPMLRDFLRRAREHGVRVALSSWYRQDAREMRLHVRTPEDQARIWIRTLDWLAAEGLTSDLLYVDLCNEFPQKAWARYLYPRPDDPELDRRTPRAIDWMRRSIELVRAVHPGLDLTYSFAGQYDTWREQDAGMLDLLECHAWLADPDTSEFNDVVGYRFDWFVPDSFDALARGGKREYFSRQDHYDASVRARIDQIAEWSRAAGLPVVTSECWSIIDYKDGPGLDWDWILASNERALAHACARGRWTGLATSNFCGPQFVGMWREVDWHRRMTDMIHDAPLDADLAP